MDSTGASFERHTQPVLFIHYNPQQSDREKYLARSKALSHAVKVGQGRRRRLRLPDRGNTGVLQHRITCFNDHHCDCATRWRLVESRCARFQLHPKNGSGDPFDGLPIAITPDVHETIIFWASPALWDCVHNQSYQKSGKSLFRLEMERDLLRLHNKLDATMFVYQAATLMSALHRNSNLDLRTMTLKRQALSALRNSIEVALDPAHGDHVNALLYATTAALFEDQETPAALHYAEIEKLVLSLENNGDFGRLSALRFPLMCVLSFDTLIAMMEARPMRLHQSPLPTCMRDMVEASFRRLRSPGFRAMDPDYLSPPFSHEFADTFRGWKVALTPYSDLNTDCDPMTASFFALQYL